MMTTVVYDNHFHLADTSSVFDDAYFNAETKELYLVFKNGTISTRVLGSEFTSDIFRWVNSWGAWWNNTLKGMPEGPRVENGAEFVHRSLLSTAAQAAEQSERVRQSEESSVSEAMLDAFERAFEESDIGGTERDWYRDGIEAALVVYRQENAGEQGSGLPETDDVPEYEGTFIGIGFVNVPDDTVTALTGLVNNFEEFVSDELGRIASVIERFDASAVRDFFKRSQ